MSPMRNTVQSGWRKWMPRSVKCLGYRGKVLVTFGLVWILVGAGINDELVIPGVPHLLIPGMYRTMLWVITGVLAIIAAFRPTGFSDAFGWAALYMMPALRTVSYSIAWTDALIPWGGGGYDNGWKFAAIYFVMAAAVWFCSGWPEPPPLERHKRWQGGRTSLLSKRWWQIWRSNRKE